MAEHDLVARPVPAAFVKWTEVQKVLEESNTSGIISTSYASAFAHPDFFSRSFDIATTPSSLTDPSLLPPHLFGCLRFS